MKFLMMDFQTHAQLHSISDEILFLSLQRLLPLHLFANYRSYDPLDKNGITPFFDDLSPVKVIYHCHSIGIR